jgi:hypothetical protein
MNILSDITPCATNITPSVYPSRESRADTPACSSFTLTHQHRARNAVGTIECKVVTGVSVLIVTEALKRRISTREFLPQPLAEVLVRDILDVARCRWVIIAEKPTQGEVEMSKRALQLGEYFVGMATAAALLFFMSAVLSDPFKKIAQLLNDRTVHTTFHDWMLILKVSVPSGLLWAFLWICFKGCERKMLETYFAKAS